MASRQLNLYKNINPNIDNGTHYSSLVSMQLALLPNLVKVVPLDNSRINSNTAKINGIINDITYVIEIEMDGDTITYYRCYYVDNYSIQSGYTILSLSVDLWGSYIDKITLNNSIIKRCNRNIDTGIYEDIKATSGNIEHYEAWHQDGANWGGIFDSRVCVVFLLQYNVSQAVFGSDKISKTEMFMINLRELKEKAVERNNDFDNYSSAEIGLDIIGGIYAVSGNIGDLDAQVIKAWLCDQQYIDTDADNLPIERGLTAKSKSIFTNGSDMTFNITHVLPSKKYKEITIENYDINKTYYVGTFNNGLKLQRYTTSNLTYSTYYIVSEDDIKVIVQQGENQKDISNAYEVLLTTNSATQTGIRRVASALNQSMRSYSSAIGNYAKGGIGLAGLGLVNDILGMVPSESYESAIGGGDGFTTFYQEQFREMTKGQLLTPYVINNFTSIFNEKEKARYNGALFIKRISNNKAQTIFNDIKSYGLLGEGTMSQTFVQMDTAVMGAPLEACDYIKNKLANGIYYQ